MLLELEEEQKVKFHTILFDLDGTLTDPKEGITKSGAYALKDVGIEESTERLTSFIGPPLKDSFMIHYHFTDLEAQRAIEKYREYYRPIGIFENKVYEGIPKLLQDLKEQGKKLAVATSKPQIFAKQILEKYNIDQYFNWIVGSELNETRVKKEEVIEEVLKQAHLSTGVGCLMVGDRKYDVEGARVFDIPTVAVKFGYAEEGELEQSRAKYVVSNVEELRSFLLNH